MNENQQAIFIYNASAGSPADTVLRLEQASECLRRQGLSFDTIIPATEEQARLISRQAAARGCPLVIVMGGDGTIEAVAPELAGSQTRLGILVGGTQNNIARTLGIPPDLESASQIITQGRCQAIDVGEIRDAEGRRHYFFEFVAIGALAAILEVREGLGNRQLSAFGAALSQFIQYDLPRFELSLDGAEPQVYETFTLTVSNTPMFGPQTRVAPGASLSDGLLDITLFPNFSKIRLAAFFAAVTGGGESGDEEVAYLQARSVTIKAEPEQPAIKDDTMLSKGPLEIRVANGSLCVMVSRDDQTLGGTH